MARRARGKGQPRRPPRRPKIARLYYSLVKHGKEYEERERECRRAALRKRAQRYGYELVAQAA
jgi:tRNA(Ile)-lysidine synthase TilS/MesJ